MTRARAGCDERLYIHPCHFNQKCDCSVLFKEQYSDRWSDITNSIKTVTLTLETWRERRQARSSASPATRIIRRRRKNISCFTAPASLGFRRIKKVSPRLNQSPECIKLRITTNRTLTAHAHYNGTPRWRCIYVLNRLRGSRWVVGINIWPKNVPLGSLDPFFSFLWAY